MDPPPIRTDALNTLKITKCPPIEKLAEENNSPSLGKHKTGSGRNSILKLQKSIPVKTSQDLDIRDITQQTSQSINSFSSKLASLAITIEPQKVHAKP